MNNLKKKYILLFSILINIQSTNLNINNKNEENFNLVNNFDKEILEKLESFKIHHEKITEIMNIIKEKNLNKKENENQLNNLFYFINAYTLRQILLYNNAYTGVFYETEYVLKNELYKNEEKIKFISDTLLPIIYNLSGSNEVFINMSYYANDRETHPLKVIKEIHENDLFGFLINKNTDELKIIIGLIIYIHNLFSDNFLYKEETQLQIKEIKNDFVNEFKNILKVHVNEPIVKNLANETTKKIENLDKIYKNNF